MINSYCAGLGLQRSPWSTHRLWSLWDMLDFCAAPFYEVIAALHQTRGMIDNWPKKRAKQPLDSEARQGWVTQAQKLQSSLKVLDAPITLTIINELLEHLEDQSHTIRHTELSSYFASIDEIIKRELSTIMLLVLEKQRHSYYNPKEPLFGKDFETRFRNVAFELDEAAKCYALGRPTACVFHLMRLMEAAIKATARCLGIPDPIKPAERNWAKMLEKIWQGIENKWPTVTDRRAGDGQKFEALYAYPSGEGHLPGAG